MSVKLLTEHLLEVLNLTGGCTGSSESTIVKMPHCGKSHVTAQIINTIKNELFTALIASVLLCCHSSRKCTTLHQEMQIFGPEVIKLFSSSTQLRMICILLINVKMPTIVGILTFMSRINTTSERLKARNFFICLYFSFYEQLKFCAQLEYEKSFITSGPGKVNIRV